MIDLPSLALGAILGHVAAWAGFVVREVVDMRRRV